MNNENKDSELELIAPLKARVKKDYALPACIVISAIILALAWIYTTGLRAANLGKAEVKTNARSTSESVPGAEVTPSSGVILPISWGDLGAQLVSAGVIDAERFQAIYDGRGEFTSEYRTLLLGRSDGLLLITPKNAAYLLNLFWALGLANKNPILDAGEMTDPRYGGAHRFASTAGWTMAKGSPMDHYSRHLLIKLTAEQQALVEKISRGIYRPCCGNSTHFPDCNHGMAMLGFLELMASRGVSEQAMWRAALAVNSYWFPDTYSTIATYLKNKGVPWQDAKPEEILGADYSSGAGYAKIAAQVLEPQSQGGGSCGV